MIKKVFSTIFFLTILFFHFAPVAVLAVDSTEIPTPKLSVSIGGFFSFQPLAQLTCDNGKAYCIDWIGQYIKVVFQYGVGLAAVLAVVMIMVGGFIWLTSGGSPDKVGKAKEYITSSLLGLFLALFSYLLLSALNPSLVNLQNIKVQRIAEPEQMCCNQGSDGYKFELVDPNYDLCRNGTKPEADLSLCFKNCCCVDETGSFACVPNVCNGICASSSNYKKYIDKRCDLLPDVQPIGGSCVDPVSQGSDCCCVTGDLVRGCSLTGAGRCIQEACTDSYDGRLLIPRSCNKIDIQISEGECK